MLLDLISESSRSLIAAQVHAKAQDSPLLSLFFASLNHLSWTALDRAIRAPESSTLQTLRNICSCWNSSVCRSEVIYSSFEPDCDMCSKQEDRNWGDQI
jgi:hypothetical protein